METLIGRKAGTLIAMSALVFSFGKSYAAGNGVPSYAEPKKVYGPLGKAPDGRAITPITNAAADLNGDGLEDLVMALWVGPLTQPGFTVPILILLNDGTGGFIDGTANIISGPIPQFFFVRQIIIADFNGDGRPDVFFDNHGLEVEENFDDWPGEQNRLLLSGPAGKLTDVTAQNLPQLSDFRTAQVPLTLTAMATSTCGSTILEEGKLHPILWSTTETPNLP